VLAGARIDLSAFEVKHLLGIRPRGAGQCAAADHAQRLDFDPLRADGVAVDERDVRVAVSLAASSAASTRTSPREQTAGSGSVIVCAGFSP
jgi:hypothetical protein